MGITKMFEEEVLSENLSTVNWSGPPNPQMHSDDEEDFLSFSSADAEYFASANLNSVEDVATAIETCKTNILETTENTTSRKSTVNRLIQLQIRQEDLKEKQELSAITFETRGHTFANYSHEIKVPEWSLLSTMWLCHMDILAIFAILHSLRIWRTLYLHGQYYANMCGSKSQKSTRFYHGYLPRTNFASIEVQMC